MKYHVPKLIGDPCPDADKYAAMGQSCAVMHTQTICANCGITIPTSDPICPE